MTLVTLALLLNGCSPQQGPARPEDTAPPTLADLSAQVDPTNGRIVLPLDRFDVSTVEQRTIDYAINVLLSRCMAQAGHTFAAIDNRASAQRSNLRYGLWVEAEAARYGYAGPPSGPEQQQLAEQNARPFSEAERRRYVACAKSAPMRDLRLPALQSQHFAMQTYRETISSADGRTLIGSWRQCLAGHGVTTHDAPDRIWAPDGALPTETEESRRIAMLDVRCKTELGLVSKLATAEARAQESIVRQHHSELRLQRRQIEDALATAEQIIADTRTAGHP
ncbi:hypothetical protein [Micromonospora schwarzwaldensis]|uniref:hypothetical protein n=1 Tax=Micromonospora sp. DSM 45708 TaxID=3111767 RepID=UPI0031CF2113